MTAAASGAAEWAVAPGADACGRQGDATVDLRMHTHTRVPHAGEVRTSSEAPGVCLAQLRNETSLRGVEQSAVALSGVRKSLNSGRGTARGVVFAGAAGDVCCPFKQYAGSASPMRLGVTGKANVRLTPSRRRPATLFSPSGAGTGVAWQHCAAAGDEAWKQSSMSSHRRLWRCAGRPS